MKKITNTNIVKNALLAAFAMLSITAFAQDEEKKKFEFSGSADAYFRTNLSTTNTADANGDFENPGTSFADQSGFALGMANIIASYEGEKVGFVADLVFGPRGEDAVFLSPDGSSNIINQLYVYWNVSEKVKLTLGNFNTFLGYEVISPAANFNYSTSYMFSNGPFSHAGLKADFTLSDDWSAMLAVMNSTDFTSFNPDGSYTFGAQLGYSGQYLNFIYGEQFGETEATMQVDYTGGFDATEDFFLGINATYNDTDGAGFYGAALYPQYSTSETFALGVRAEYFGFHVDGFDDQTVLAATLSANYKVGDLTIIPEIRLDSWADDLPEYIDNDGAPTNSLSSFLLAAVYSF